LFMVYLCFTIVYSLRKVSGFGGQDQSELWYLSLEIGSDLRTRYLFSPNDSLEPLTDDDVLSQRSNATCVDIFNPKQHKLFAYEDDPEDEHDTIYSVLELPDAPTLRYTKSKDGVPLGSVSKHRFQSEILANERSIWLYQPHSSYSSEKTELAIFFDGWNYSTAIPTPTILDNLIYEGRIKPTFALFIEHDLWEDREKELACNDQFLQFLAAEVLPWNRGQTGLSTYADATTLVGSSLGGLAACYLAIKRPDLFGKVVSQSCAVSWVENHLIPEFEARPKQDLRIYLDMGAQEYSHSAGRHSSEMLIPFPRLLDSKNHETVYREYNGGHDYQCWAASLSEGLSAFSNGAHDSGVSP